MRKIRFYLPKPFALNTSVELNGDACHHAVNVLRMKQGDALTVFNGEGGEYDASIISASKKMVVIQLHQFNAIDRVSLLHTHLAIGLSKGERFDWVLQKATELGVSEITPIFTKHMEVHLNAERLEKVQQRWQKIIINTCEQCYRNRLPILNVPVEFSALLATEKCAQKFILHPPEDYRASALDTSQKPASVCLLVGPEGGFSDQEVSLATKYHFALLAFGARILRTETAPLAALSVIQFVWGDFSNQCRPILT